MHPKQKKESGGGSVHGQCQEYQWTQKVKSHQVKAAHADHEISITKAIIKRHLPTPV